MMPLGAALIALAVGGPPSEKLTYDAYSLGGAIGRQLLLHGVRTYSPACDIDVRPLAANAWNKSLLLEGGFVIEASVYREPTLTGFGLTIDKPAANGFSWEWFDIESGNVFRKLQGPGRVAVEVAKGPGYEELRSVEFLDDITLRYRDDSTNAPGAHTHEVVVRKGSVLRVAPRDETAPASPCPARPPQPERPRAAAPQLTPEVEKMQLWLTYYYLDPRPELALSSLDVIDREMQKQGRSIEGEAARGGLRSFYARVFAQNDSLVAETAARLPTLPSGQQTFLREVLRRCATAACMKALGPGAATPPSPSAVIDPATLDDWWAAFFATGEADYVRKIVAVLPWSEVRGDTDRLITGSAARWSLTSNAYQHARVLAVCEEIARTATEPTAGLLRAIIDDAKAERAKTPPPDAVQKTGRKPHNN
jgi:hypothetical protein